jgi:hypothetical protein
MTAHALRLLARDCHALADRLAHRRQVLAFLDRAEHALLTVLVDTIVAAPTPRDATTRSGVVHLLRYR